MTKYPNNEQRGDQHVDRQPDLPGIKRTLTCGHTIIVTFRKNAHYCEACRARRRPIAAADEVVEAVLKDAQNRRRAIFEPAKGA